MLTRILVVEDSRSLRRMICTALAVDGYDVVEAEDAEHAHTLMRLGPADLVITDVHMPKTDGLTFVRSLRALPEYRDTPILVVTTERSEEMKQRGLAAGATGWIVKPFDPERLRQVVGRLLWRRAEAG